MPEPFLQSGQKLSLPSLPKKEDGTSFGVCASDLANAQSAEEILSFTDQAMYESKKNKKTKPKFREEPRHCVATHYSGWSVTYDLTAPSLGLR